jgi:hypothetical protein
VNNNAIATRRKATPIDILVIPRPRLGTSWPSNPCLLPWPECDLGRCPVSASETRLRFAPQDRQNFTSSAFEVAHLGQYIIR